MFARLLAAEDLPHAEPHPAPAHGAPKLRWLRWLFSSETLGDVQATAVQGRVRVGSLKWLLGSETLPAPAAAPELRSGFRGVNMSWLLAGEPLETPDEVKEPRPEQRFDHE